MRKKESREVKEEEREQGEKEGECVSQLSTDPRLPHAR